MRHNKFAEQHNKDPAFFRHEKHVFILSFAGRPIFSRYGDETLLAAYMGVISAIIRYGAFFRARIIRFLINYFKFLFLFLHGHVLVILILSGILSILFLLF